MLVGLLLSAICVATMLLFNFGNYSLLWSAVQNAGHFVLFTLLTVSYLSLFKPKSLRQPLKHFAAILTLICLGAFVEFVQSGMPERNASVHDLLLDTAGILAGYLIFTVIRYVRSLSVVRVVGILALLFSTAYFATHQVLDLSAYHLLKTSSPVVISFDDAFVESIISAERNASFTLEKNRLLPNTDSTRLLRMNFARTRYSGVVLHDTKNNWGETGFLSFTLHNTSAHTRKIVLRIHDRDHNNNYNDRYNTTLFVKSGTNYYRLPLQEITLLRNGRQLDMENIHELQFFSMEPERFSVHLSDLYITSL